MQSKVFEGALMKLKMQKSELIERLVSFVLTDTILYLPNEASVDDKIRQVNLLLKTKFVRVGGVDVPLENVSQQQFVRQYLSECAAEKVAFIYLAATEIRSVLLAVLWAEKKLNAKEVFKCAFFEEIEEQKQWGEVEEIKERNELIKDKLNDLEKWRDERSLFKN